MGHDEAVQRCGDDLVAGQDLADHPLDILERHAQERDDLDMVGADRLESLTDTVLLQHVRDDADLVGLRHHRRIKLGQEDGGIAVDFGALPPCRQNGVAGQRSAHRRVDRGRAESIGAAGHAGTPEMHAGTGELGGASDTETIRLLRIVPPGHHAESMPQHVRREDIAEISGNGLRIHQIFGRNRSSSFASAAISSSVSRAR